MSTRNYFTTISNFYSTTDAVMKEGYRLYEKISIDAINMQDILINKEKIAIDGSEQKSLQLQFLNGIFYTFLSLIIGGMIVWIATTEVNRITILLGLIGIIICLFIIYRISFKRTQKKVADIFEGTKDELENILDIYESIKNLNKAPLLERNELFHRYTSSTARSVRTISENLLLLGGVSKEVDIQSTQEQVLGWAIEITKQYIGFFSRWLEQSTYDLKLMKDDIENQKNNSGEIVLELGEISIQKHIDELQSVKKILESSHFYS